MALAPVRRFALLAATALLVAPTLSACAGGDAENTADVTAAKAEPSDLQVVVSNDDGYAAPGLDALVEALRAYGAEVTVVAPAEEKSGTGGTYTDGEVTHSEQKTASGYPATAVDGYPADTIRVAVEDLALKPDLVISGTNKGQNNGSFIDLSGTIGAARSAVAFGIPALAVSASFGPVEKGYEVGAQTAVDWVEENLDALVAGKAPVHVTNLNVPSCAAGNPKELVEVPLSAKGAADEPDCTSTLTDPKDDVEALAAGFITSTVIPDEPATPPQAVQPGEK